VRSNSEAIVGVRGQGQQDYSTGLAITSGLYVDADTHVEVVRYPKGSDALAPLSTLLTDGGTRITRPLRFLSTIIRHPLDFLKTLVPFGWAQRTIILLVMQSLDNRLRLVLRRSWLRPWRRHLSSTKTHGAGIPTFIPAANAAARAIAKQIGGIPLSSVNEVVLNVPMTAHILGGCPMGNSAADGVVDVQHRVFGYEHLYVIDGSSVPANLGVNPSLTITALAEHAMRAIPDKAGAEKPAPVRLST
jgi:cholesterol oxidase